MFWIAIGLIAFGIGKIAIPQYFRYYKTWEIFGEKEEPGKLEMVLERIMGFVSLIAGVSILLYS